MLKELVHSLPEYDYLYLGDNARAPYGNRSFETVKEYTWECVQELFRQGCHLIILACNTASAKALRSIQQLHLPPDGQQRVLGVIRPTTEIVGNYTHTGHIGVLGTTGTIASLSYPLEIEKFFPGTRVFQQACPMWVPLVENNEHLSEGADYFIQKDLRLLMEQSPRIDTLVLGCTHYPLLIGKIRQYLKDGIKVLSQSEIVAQSLKDYLHRHPALESLCAKNSRRRFFTSDDPAVFDRMATTFFGQTLQSEHLAL